ncbi:mechanosensitive ion channel family protein [Saprospiraceae bacterium]|nr:mechanosensitive ion channel family protein [Saprospiraceae bacterium]
MLDIVNDWLVAQGLNVSVADTVLRVIIFALIILVSWISYYIAKYFLLKGVTAVISKTETLWDDKILSNKVFSRLAKLVPAVIIYKTIPIPLEGHSMLISVATGFVMIYIIIMVVLAVDAFLNAALEIYTTYEVSNRIPIKGFIQVFKILIYFTGAIFIISILMNKTPTYLFSGLGALTAVLMFIFKDAILGFVAGIQLSANRMVANGDWIEMPKYGADGDIIEIALTTVKVQNWDKTITTIPTYALITDSFKNWRGMTDSPGRRIKRSINLDMNTVKFCDEEMLSRFSKINYISEYIKKTKSETQEKNKLANIDDSNLVNGTRMTNIGTFRAYVKAYLSNIPEINKDMTFLVRQLAPNENGLPIEIYVFSSDKNWGNYENIQANIFDHLLAVIPEFDLQVFQNPSGGDFRKLG